MTHVAPEFSGFFFSGSPEKIGHVTGGRGGKGGGEADPPNQLVIQRIQTSGLSTQNSLSLKRVTGRTQFNTHWARHV